MQYTLKEWKAELKRRFGDNIEDYKFVCPACEKVSSGGEFKKAGAEPDDIYQNCIGRFTGKKAAKDDSKDGCNWAAYGLFGTFGKGDVVITEDGEKVAVFKMAEK